MPRVRILATEAAEAATTKATAGAAAATSATTTAAAQSATTATTGAAASWTTAARAAKSATAWAAARAAKRAGLHHSAKRPGNVAIVKAVALHVLNSVVEIILAESRQAIGLALLSADGNGLTRRCRGILAAGRSQRRQLRPNVPLACSRVREFGIFRPCHCQRLCPASHPGNCAWRGAGGGQPGPGWCGPGDSRTRLHRLRSNARGEVHLELGRLDRQATVFAGRIHHDFLRD